VDQSRHDFFSHATFAVDEYGHIHRSNLHDLLADAHHLRAGRQKAQVFRNRVAILAQGLIFRAQLLLLPTLQHGHVKFGFFKRFGQVILCAQADGFHHIAHFIGTGKHNHVERAVNQHELLQGLQAIQIRHQYIEDDEIGAVAAADLFNCFLAGDYGFDLIAFYFQQRA